MNVWTVEQLIAWTDQGVTYINEERLQKKKINIVFSIIWAGGQQCKSPFKDLDIFVSSHPESFKTHLFLGSKNDNHPAQSCIQ